MKKPIIMTQERLKQLIEDRVREELAARENEQQMEILKKQADIAMLQAQINPHFLYNTLECIRGQAVLSNVPDIAAVAEALSGFFRYSISTREDIVSLREELLNVENYVSIQKYRFRDRFELRLKVDRNDDILIGSALPKLTLQPLVENAILHAFNGPRRHGAFICISAELTEKHINVHVTDNGTGISPDVLDRLNAEMYDTSIQPQKTGHGIALMNVHRRLAYLFGSGYGLSISSEVGIGTDIELHIPRRTPAEMLAGVKS